MGSEAGPSGRRRRYKLRPPPVERPAFRFNRAVRQALAGLPDALRGRLDNVDIIVQNRPTPTQLRTGGIGRGGMLLGLYEGTPLSVRTAGYSMVLPDRIYLFRSPLEAISADEQRLTANIRRTVLHEIAHHFGIDDARLHEIGAY